MLTSVIRVLFKHLKVVIFALKNYVAMVFTCV